MAGKTSYLKHLRFDPKLNNSFVARYIRNTRLVILLVLLIVFAGIFSFINIPKVLNPDVRISIIIVTSALPGAGPQDVESLVTIPIENSISGLPKIDTVTSTSQESVSITTVQFLSGVDPDKAKQDVQSAVDSVTNLPKDATIPKVQKLDFQNVPVWSFIVSGSSDIASLMSFSTNLQTRLKDVRTIDHVTTSGLETQEIQVIIKPEAISTYNLNPQLLNAAITSATNSYPAGAIKTDKSNFALTIDPEVTTVDDIRNLRLNINGQSVLFSDIATIFLKSKPNHVPSYLATSTTKPARTVRFDVYKTSSTTIDQAIADAKKITNNTLSQYNGHFKIYSILDTQNEIRKQFDELIHDLIITVILVFITLLIFLGLRQALVASVSIPLTFMISFIVMNMAGIALSFIAFFSLLLSLGLLVDDTVVVISAMTSYFRTGKFTPLQTGLLVWRDFITAIFTTTITTVWAFLPMLLSTGIIGEFIKPVPIVVSSTLLASFGVAMLITLPFIVVLLKGYFPRRVIILTRILIALLIIGIGVIILPKNKLFIIEILFFVIFLFVTYTSRRLLFARIKNMFVTLSSSLRGVLQSRTAKQSPRNTRLLRHVPDGTWLRFARNDVNRYLDQGFVSFEHIGKVYRRVLDKILSSSKNRRRTIIIVVLFSVFSYILVPLGFVRNEFFPKSDQNYLYVNIELPPGTNLDFANKEALSILNELKQTKNVSFVSANIGLGLNPGTGGYSSQGFNNILFSLVLPEKGYRKLSSIDVAEEIRNKYKNYTKGNFSVTEASGGPPAGADVQIKLFGNDLTVVDSYANKLTAYLKKQPGLGNVNKTIKPGTSKIVFVPDKDKIALNGLSIDAIGFWFRTYASGFSTTSIKLEGDNNQSKDITIRTNSAEEYAETVSNLSIPTPNGNIPISSLGTFTAKANPTIITRENGKRTISVIASVRPGFSVNASNQNLQKYANSLNLPQGYSWSTGGVNEENQKSVNSIIQAMLLSFLLILVTMVLQFNSFRRAFIVMLVIPLSISGVFIIFALFHIPLSFPALIGVLALFGIVVKNAILVVDKIMVNIKAGLDYKYAIIDGAESRLEPIALTSFATILGLIPITLSNALWQGLGGAIIAGLLFSGSIMLFFIPVVYYIMFNPGKK